MRLILDKRGANNISPRLTKKMNRHTLFIILFLALLGPWASSHGFETDFYAANSVLSQGRWVRIRVPETGLYRISASTLRSWGFSNPENVRIYGYGGKRQANILSKENYIDDLPLVQSTVDAGVVFFGVGPGQWETTDKEGYSFQCNVFTNYGYYYVTEGGESRPTSTTGTPGADNPTTYFKDRAHHELELSTPGSAGAALVGEDMRYNRTLDIDFSVTDYAPEAKSWVEVSYVSHLSSSGTILQVAHNDSLLGHLSLPATSTSHYVHGNEIVKRFSFKASPTTAGKSRISLKLIPTTTPSKANLNYVSFNYPRRLNLPQTGYLHFCSSAKQLSLACTEGTTIWDVTEPLDIKAVQSLRQSDKNLWTMTGQGNREYVAWRTGATLPAPQFDGTVKNQDLHSHSSVTMVIVSPSEYYTQAQRLAQFHTDRQDSISVRLVLDTDIYNEFGSGSADPGALRKYFKMLYDRGQSGNGDPLQYAILFARMTIDNRHLLESSGTYPTIPGWTPWTVRSALSDNEGYFTDDVTAMLADNSGNRLGADKLSIAIGRIPALDNTEARQLVDKIIQYAENSKKTAWKHRFMFLADDEDNGIHLQQTEKMINGFAGRANQYQLVRKVYMDAYARQGNVYPEARATMFRYLDEGVVWWNFIGHASTSGWTHDGQLSYSDVNNMYLTHWPFIFAATCDFLRLDGQKVSGAEILYKERYGGAIGIVSATRPVYISDNEKFSSAVGRMLARRNDKGHILTPGEIYRLAKNDIRDNSGQALSDENRLRYVFVGDPALPLATPSNDVRLDSINGIPVDGNQQPVMAALSRSSISGTILDSDGEHMENFNGVAMVEIFDAERTVTTNGYGQGKVENFEDYGGRVFYGSAPVKNGRFSMEIAMPEELSQNFREATMSLYAYSTETNDEAVGINRDFYVYGFDENAVEDTEAPVIESLILNHENFKNGATINADPMLIATISDNVGLNLSSAGVGHQMTVILDGTQSYNDVNYYFTPNPDGSPSGVINYPLENLLAGNHTLKLRIWDTSGNSASSEIDFFVVPGLAPTIFDVYSDANPASTEANFYLKHNQPEGMATVTITVYTLMGKPVWSSTVKGKSDMFLTVPVNWDLCDYSGRRIERGIYLYRASVTTDEQTYETATRRIAVTAQ